MIRFRPMAMRSEIACDILPQRGRGAVERDMVPLVQRTPVVLNLFQDPCLGGCAGLEGAALVQAVKHGPRIKSGVTVGSRLHGGAGLGGANLAQTVRHGC